MTWEEKNTIIAACATYRELQQRAEKRYIKSGEKGKADRAAAEAHKAENLMTMFAGYLVANPGTITI